MNFDFLLAHREELRRAARLANLAYAYQYIGNFAWKNAWTGVKGEVILQKKDGDEFAKLIGQDVSQSVIDEHFLPEEINELHEVLSSVHDSGAIIEMKFRLEGLGDVYRPALRRVLEIADVLPKHTKEEDVA
jgi:hypothetical protein